jgi:hypothetical protein
MEQNNKKRDDNNDQRSQEGGSGDGMPRFNFMWIYILIGVGLLALQMTKFSGASKNATWADFERWSKKGHIQRLVVVNDKEAYVYIIADSLTASKEHEGIKPTKKTMFSSDQPQYVMNIGKVEVLEPKWPSSTKPFSKRKSLRSLLNTINGSTGAQCSLLTDCRYCCSLGCGFSSSGA